MAIENLGGLGGDGAQGIAFLVAGEIVSTFVAKACSSPQTTELNADKRAPTLIKWVNIGIAESVLFLAFAAWVDKTHRTMLLAGGIAEIIITYAEYLHARSAGLKSTEPPTEKW